MGKMRKGWKVQSIVSWGPRDFDWMDDAWFAMRSWVGKEGKEGTERVAEGDDKGDVGVTSQLWTLPVNHQRASRGTKGEQGTKRGQAPEEKTLSLSAFRTKKQRKENGRAQNGECNIALAMFPDRVRKPSKDKERTDSRKVETLTSKADKHLILILPCAPQTVLIP